MANPGGSLIADTNGDLFGTTSMGGANSAGTIFEMTASGFVIPVLLPRVRLPRQPPVWPIAGSVSHTFNGTVTITNISSSPISGPFQILFMELTTGVALANATAAFFGLPYRTVPAVASLAAGQAATVSVQFGNPSFGAINFTPVIYSGSF
jgi:uncharacterized repeat protein (TIGR03803 family)